MIATFVIVGICYFKSDKFKSKFEVIVDSTSYSDYFLEFIAEGSPAWPFGGQNGRVELKDKEGKIISSVDVYVLNDGNTIKKANWKVHWEDMRVIVEVGGFEASKNSTYYLYYDGRIE